MEKAREFFKKIIPRRVFLFFQPSYHFLLALWAALFYGFPARRLIVMGITGTKGKTTAVELVHKILEESGAKTASLSSLRFRVGDKETSNLKKMTMPGRMFVQKFLHEARKARCKYAILEVTSEGIKQFRHRFIKFEIAVMTNVAPEHIEAHGSFEKYLRAKLDLFWRLRPAGLAIINRDDPNSSRFSAATAAHKMFYGRESINMNGKSWALRDIKISDAGIEFDIDGIAIASPLLGEFNFYNILAALSVGLSQHIALDKIAVAISRVSGIPGRMEFIPAFVKTSAGEQKEFTVVVDYAHTPDSLREVYSFLKNYKLQTTNYQLICVLGSTGGGRDKWKRPEMGKIAAEFCGEIILTNEDPYDENPEEILGEIASGFSEPTTFKKILDRREAIREALKSAKAGDTVIITGKGAEQWIISVNNNRIPWDDRTVVKEELTRITARPAPI